MARLTESAQRRLSPGLPRADLANSSRNHAHPDRRPDQQPVPVRGPADADRGGAGACPSVSVGFLAEPADAPPVSKSSEGKLIPERSADLYTTETKEVAA